MTTKKKIEKIILHRRWYKKDPVVISAIQYCVDWNFSTKDALDYLFTTLGCSMDERTFRRIKKNLPTSNTQRAEIMSTETITFTQESIGELRIAKYELVKIISNSDTSMALKIQACTALTKNLVTMIEFYDSSPVIASLARIKDDNEKAFQKPKEISEKKLP